MDNHQIVKSIHQALWHDKSISAVEQYFHEEARIHSPIKETQGIAQFKEVLQNWYTGFPNLVVHWDDYISEGDKVVARWHAEGRHEGEFLGLPPSHKTVQYSGVTIYELTEGKISQYWAFVDMTQLSDQLKSIQ